jgi:spore coat protein H
MKRSIILILLLIVTSVGCKKVNLIILGNILTLNGGIWEDRPEGISCNKDTVSWSGEHLSFKENHMLCVNIKMDSDDFEVMRYESTFGPSIKDDNGSRASAALFEQVAQCDVPWPSEYNWYSAEVNIDGIDLYNIGIRKKGFFGSIFSDAPSMKLDFAKYNASNSIAGIDNITLNNNSEDPTRIKNCVGFRLFEMAGYPTPRCNLANISVNNEALGVYTHLEPISDDFLVRNFGNNAGHLYEGQVVDFVEDWLPRWQAKTANTNELGAPLISISDVLNKTPDDDLIAKLDDLLDIDRFITFWAMEIILEHTDGYTTNRNNFYVYFDPSDQERITLIPWGLNYFNDEENNKNTAKAYVKGELARRLSRITETTLKLENEISRIMNNVWDEGMILQMVQEFSLQVKSAQNDPNYDDRITEFKNWVKNRPSEVEELLKDGIPEGKKNQTNRCFLN